MFGGRRHFRELLTQSEEGISPRELGAWLSVTKTQLRRKQLFMHSGSRPFLDQPRVGQNGAIPPKFGIVADRHPIHEHPNVVTFHLSAIWASMRRL